VQPAAEHDRQADAAADPDQHEVLDAPGGARLRLGDRGQVDVVLEHDRGVQVVAQRGEQPPVPAGQVERERDVAAGRVDQTRGAEHDPPYR
jgi:hypothetical protein